MRAGEELEEDGRVDGEVPANAKAPQGSKAADGSKVGSAGRNHAPDCCHPEGEIESPPAAKHITAKAPKHRAGKETNILGEREKGRPMWKEFIRDWRDWISCQ